MKSVRRESSSVERVWIVEVSESTARGEEMALMWLSLNRKGRNGGWIDQLDSTTPFDLGLTSQLTPYHRLHLPRPL